MQLYSRDKATEVQRDQDIYPREMTQEESRQLALKCEVYCVETGLISHDFTGQT